MATKTRTRVTITRRKTTINKVNVNFYSPKGGPSFVAPPLWGSASGNSRHVLTDETRAQLAAISSHVRFRKGERIYAEGDRADAVFNIITGVVKSYRSLPNARRYILGFRFRDDLIGLAEEGRYVNSAEAVTAVCGYRIPVTALEAKLRKDSGLDFQIICKLCHELREAQCHAFLLSRRHAVGRLGLFLQMLENYQTARSEGAEEIYLPMSRSDIGNYIGISLEAVSRSFRALSSRGVIAFRNRRHVKIIDRAGLNDIASESEMPRLRRRRAGPAE
jgi:CRP-like cAMP-binding protein